jgi:hypothetical protein
MIMSILSFTGWSQLNENTDTPTKSDISAIIIAAGYPEGSAPYTMAKIITTKEGWKQSPNGGKGTRSWRNNNPGNLDYQNNFKTLDPDVTIETKLNGSKGRYAKFSTPVLGMKALIEYKIIRWAGGNMPGTTGNQTMIVDANAGAKWIKGEKPTVAQFFYTYAPPNQNDTEAYIASFIKAVKVLNPEATRTTLVQELLD